MLTHAFHFKVRTLGASLAAIDRPTQALTLPRPAVHPIA